MIIHRLCIILVVIFDTLTASHSARDQLKTSRRLKRKSIAKNKTESECTMNFCEKDTSYPKAAIRKLMKESSLSPFYMDQYEEPVMLRFAVHQEPLCQITTKRMNPVRASTGFGSKEYVVQTGVTKQSIYIEACVDVVPKTFAKFDCLPEGYGVICQQQYRLIPLWVYDEKEKNLKSSKFKVPSGCTLHYVKHD